MQITETELIALVNAGALQAVAAIPVYYTAPNGENTPIGFNVEVTTRYHTQILQTQRGHPRRFRKLQALWNWAQGIGINTLIVARRQNVTISVSTLEPK